MADRPPLRCRLFGHRNTYRVSLRTGALLSVTCERCGTGDSIPLAIEAHEAAPPAESEAPRG